MAQTRLAGTPPSGGPDHAPPSSDAPRSAPRSREGIHFVPNDGRRFPICGSWRSNWNHTGDPERATCPACRARLAPP